MRHIQHVMFDHPSWLSADGWAHHRAVRIGGAVGLVTAVPGVAGTTAVFEQVHGELRAPLAEQFDVFDPVDLRGDEELADRLRRDGSVSRLRNPDVWDALATAVIRQVIRASHARTLYRRLCAEHGETVANGGRSAALLPSAATVLALADAEFGRLGLAFKTVALRAAARAYLDLGTKWAEMDSVQLVRELQTVPRIGPWTAKAAVADLTNDFALYDYTDLAVRTWVRRLAPERLWPEDSAQFAPAWEAVAGDQMSDWTALTLAWGVRHATGVAL